MGAARVKIRRIGNSRGILFPKSVLEESGLSGTVEIIVKDNTIMISQAEDKPKKTWDDFKPRKKEKSDFVSNKFDATDWSWE